VGSDKPARIRLYGSLAAQNADVARPIGTDPIGDHQLLFEYVTVSSALSSYLSPLVDGASFEDPPSENINISITNLSEAAGIVTVTLMRARTE
jgi:hypothetical protein